MAEPFLSEIRIMAINYAPVGWAMCNGQLMPINQNQALFALLGTTYGGNGQTTFALPDLRGRVPIHFGAGFTLGQKGGEEVHTITQNEMPAHTHLINATNNLATAATPTGLTLAQANANIYGGTSDLTTMAPATISNVGGSQPHENRQPFLALTFCIALIGIFPSRN